jgi:4-carboxymuconolactone decarboxylase
MHKTGKPPCPPWRTIVLATLLSATTPAISVESVRGSPLAPQQAADARFDKGMRILRDLNQGRPQPVFEAMRSEFPFLAEATASYALGDVWGREVLDPKTRQLAAAAAFAALGLRSFFKTHAAYALNVGATPDELKEIVYLITVPAGFPRAIEASQSLQELFIERQLVGAQPQPAAPRR